MDIQGIQMIGTQRSGSNLLRLMIDGLGSIYGPHPPHILQRFIPLLPYYGNLALEENFHRLTTDVCELVNINPVPWEGVRIDVDEIECACKTHSLYEIFLAIYETAARQNGAAFWLCKSMKNVFFAKEIEKTGIRPYYIYLYRDGRDVALSFQKAIVGEKHIYPIAVNWMNDQEEALRLRERTSPDHFFTLSYETLTREPKTLMHQLCKFLHVPYTDQVMDYYKTRESANTAEAGKMWSNVSKPLLRHNTRKFLREMPAEDIAIFESVAGKTLQKLGYETVTTSEKLRTSFSEEEIAGFMAENARLKKAFLEQADADDIAKRRPQDELIARIKTYNY